MLEKIEAWYREAANLHGDDWPNIETYVARKIAAASSADHGRFMEQMRALLGNKGAILH
jgi:hypothetical protein